VGHGTVSTEARDRLHDADQLQGNPQYAERGQPLRRTGEPSDNRERRNHNRAIAEHREDCAGANADPFELFDFQLVKNRYQRVMKLLVSLGRNMKFVLIKILGIDRAVRECEKFIEV
jgi:hypothetical protein